MLKISYRVYEKATGRMFNFVRRVDYDNDIWEVWVDNELPRDQWKSRKFQRSEITVMPFIGKFDNTEWNGLHDWEKVYWTFKGYTESTWKGKEIYYKDIILVVCDGRIERAKVVMVEHYFCLESSEKCIMDIPCDRKTCKTYVMGNSKENPNMLEFDPIVYRPIKLGIDD